MNYQFLPARGALNEADSDQSTGLTRTQDRVENLTKLSIPQSVVEMVPESVARENRVVPLAFDGETLTFAAANADDIALADKLRFILAKNVRLVPAPAAPEAISEALNRIYGSTTQESVDSMLQLSDSELELSLDEAEYPLPRGKGGFARHRTALPMPTWGGRIPQPAAAPAPPGSYPKGRDNTPILGGSGMFFYVVEEGQRVLVRRPDGRMEVVVGPRRVWRGRKVFQPMRHFVAHPDQFLIVRFRDGRQEHIAGPADVWFDPRVHLEITQQEALQLSAKEAVVCYSRAAGADAITRHIVYGPTLFVPEPGQWLHTFSWHASVGGSRGAPKVAHALVFQKLWLMPDQMYHDVTDVRTADDAVLSIRLMIFFELMDIERMLDSTHDPIGDFVNAATSDVVDFTGRYDFESFKRNTARLNELETYRQLTGRAGQCGYRINKVVFRGYGAAAALQQMHDQAIEARTRLQLDRATEQQAQELENYKLDCQLARAGKRRAEQSDEVEHDLAMARKRQEAELRQREAGRVLMREFRRQEQEEQLNWDRRKDNQQREHLVALRDLGVDLTAYLTQARADRVIEVRGAKNTHVHLDQAGGAKPAIGAS
jgi:hypothetical protein